MRARVLAATAAGSLVLAPPALAKTIGDAPIRATPPVTSDHVAFTLPGGPWSPVVAAGARAPGRYTARMQLEQTTCTFTAAVSGATATRRPVMRARLVPTGTSSRAPKLLVNNRGLRGPVRWWAGIVGDADGHEVAGAVGVQLLPRRLATSRRRYLVYRATIEQHPSPASAEGYACLQAARRISIRIARTMHVAAGPPAARSSG